MGFVFLALSSAVEKLISAVDSGLAGSDVADLRSGQGRSLWGRLLRCFSVTAVLRLWQ